MDDTSLELSLLLVFVCMSVGFLCERKPHQYPSKETSLKNNWECMRAMIKQRFLYSQNKFQGMQSKYPISAAKCKCLYSRVDYKYGLFHQMSVTVVIIAVVPQEKQYSIVVISIGSSAVSLTILLLLFFGAWGKFS